MSAAFSWNQFKVRIPVRAPAETLYNAWATRSGIESWFLRLSEFRRSGAAIREQQEQAKEGDSYKWLWWGWPDETVEFGTILRANGKDELSFSFGKAGDCTVRIFSELDQTIVELVQEHIPDDEDGKHDWHLGCKTGWTFYFANLKSVYEGGIDLRNKNESLKGVINS